MSVNRLEMTLPVLCTTPHALASQIDAHATVILDIRRNWENRVAAGEAQAALRQRQAASGSMLLRVGKPSDDTGQSAIEQLAALRPHGFVLSGCGGVADIQKFDVMLRVAEASHGIEAGSIGLVAELGEDLAFLLSHVSLKDVSRRLIAVILDSDGVTEATKSQAVNTAALRTGAPLLLARGAAVIKARQAGLPCYELLKEMDADPRTMRDIALADGFSGVVARNEAQLVALAGG